MTFITALIPLPVQKRILRDVHSVLLSLAKASFGPLADGLFLIYTHRFVTDLLSSN